MENLALEISRSLERVGRVRVVALGGSQRNLVWFLPLAAIRTLIAVTFGRVSTVLVGDPVVLLALWPVLAVRRRVRVVVVVHGLDLTLDRRSYRTLVRHALRRADTVVAISEATKREAVKIGVDPSRVEIVLPGLPIPGVEVDRAGQRAAVVSAAALSSDRVVVSTVGRLVTRKGQAWFASEVLPLLPSRYVYVIAGSGPGRDAIVAAALRSGVSDRCVLLGTVDEAVREALLGASDVFVVPNIAVPGDMEGFGLVAAEAALRGTPVVSARLEGLVDAVVEGETGTICEPGDAAAFAAAVIDIIEGDGLGRPPAAVASTAASRFGTERLDRDLSGLFGLFDR